MQNLAEAGGGEVCRDCKAEVAGTALRCAACKALLHLRCSDLPKYYLVLIGISRVTYTCKSCVMNRAAEHFEEYEREVSALINASLVGDDLRDHINEASVAGAESSAPSASQVLGDQIHPQDGTVDRRDESSSGSALASRTSRESFHWRPSEMSSRNNKVEDKQVRGRICRFYKFGGCKYGVKGEECPYEHPKKCLDFLKSGVRGCDKGKGCRYFHPPLCRNSEAGRRCTRQTCKFLHLRGAQKIMKQGNRRGERKTISTTLASRQDLQSRPFAPLTRERDADCSERRARVNLRDERVL